MATKFLKEDQKSHEQDLRPVNHCPGDGQPGTSWWWHWSGNWSLPPSTTNTSIKSWPDMSDFTSKYATGFPNLGNGSAATGPNLRGRCPSDREDASAYPSWLCW